jgi:large subunit ribosomal protein L23
MAFRVFFPNVPLIIRPGGDFSKTRGVIHFETDPRQTKIDIRNQLQRIYGIKVIKVNTINYQGKLKRDWRTKRWIQRKRWKKAIVTIDTSKYLEELKKQNLVKMSEPEKATELIKEAEIETQTAQQPQQPQPQQPQQPQQQPLEAEPVSEPKKKKRKLFGLF